MSLGHRLNILVISLLCVGGIAAGLAAHAAAQRGPKAELERRVAVRLAWLDACLSVDLHDGELHLSARHLPTDAAEIWQVETTDGKILWVSGTDVPNDASGLLTATHIATWGEPSRSLVTARDIRSLSELAWERTPAVIRAATLGALPDFLVDRVKKTTENGTPVHQLSGIAGGREYNIIEVALRRDHPAEDYFSALGDALDGVSRLEKLVRALLQLGRVPDRTTFRGQPVSVTDLLRRIGQTSSKDALLLSLQSRSRAPASGAGPGRRKRVWTESGARR